MEKRLLQTSRCYYNNNNGNIKTNSKETTSKDYAPILSLLIIQRKGSWQVPKISAIIFLGTSTSAFYFFLNQHTSQPKVLLQKLNYKSSHKGRHSASCLQPQNLGGWGSRTAINLKPVVLQWVSSRPDSKTLSQNTF